LSDEDLNKEKVFEILSKYEKLKLEKFKTVLSDFESADYSLYDRSARNILSGATWAIVTNGRVTVFFLRAHSSF
jgi:hypothetical protein